MQDILLRYAHCIILFKGFIHYYTWFLACSCSCVIYLWCLLFYTRCGFLIIFIICLTMFFTLCLYNFVLIPYYRYLSHVCLYAFVTLKHFVMLHHCVLPEAKLAAGNTGVNAVKTIVTHGAPRFVVFDLQTTFTWRVSADESQVQLYSNTLVSTKHCVNNQWRNAGQSWTPQAGKNAKYRFASVTVFWFRLKKIVAG